MNIWEIWRFPGDLTIKNRGLTGVDSELMGILTNPWEY